MSDDEFGRLLAPHRAELRVHCYRLLGSSHDSDDLVQETMLRAWRARESLSGPSFVRPWLYRIATNACLDELEKRPRRALASDLYAPTDPRRPLSPRDEDVPWLEPMPDLWLEGVASTPAARYALKESVGLAFVAALQELSATQRATLLLRDVVGFSAEETAHALGQSLSTVNSALLRARQRIETMRARNGRTGADENVDRAVLAKYVQAFDTHDVDALVAILHADVRTTMPPIPMWFAGRADNEVFYRGVFAAHHRGGLRVTPAHANGEPAFAFYRSPAPGEPRRLSAIQVIGIRDGSIASIDHFGMAAVCALFGLPP